MKTVVSCISDRIRITRANDDLFVVDLMRGETVLETMATKTMNKGETIRIQDIIVIPARYLGSKDGEDFPELSSGSSWECA
jgi:hypothetical protein